MSFVPPDRDLPPGFRTGPLQGHSIIGEVTESLHRFLLDGWTFDTPPPRIEEDLSFVPKDREEVIYVYMYRAAQNTALLNSKQWRAAKVTVFGPQDTEEVYYERAPIYLQLFYAIAVHSKFRSEAERLMGWLLLRLYDATHLVYRPRRYILPDGREVDSMGQTWNQSNTGDDVIMEKVSLALADDLTIGDAINFFTIHEAPYRPFLTYRAQCAMEGYLVSGPPTTVRNQRSERMEADPLPEGERPSGRMKAASSAGRIELRPERAPVRANIGPQGHGHRPIADDPNQDSED